MAHEVAKTIVRQLGPLALRMIGARHLVAEPLALTFRIGRNGKPINRVRIELDEGRDLYNVAFTWVANGPKRGPTETIRATHEGIYCDGLADLIEAETGLYTHY